MTYLSLKISPAALALACLFVATVHAGQPLSGIYVGVREFVVTVSPVDEESKNAENSDLYQRRGLEHEWVNLGACEKITHPNGEVRFVKTVSVETDGLFHYTSRPVVGGKVENPPDRHSPAQASVVVDTLAPIVEIVNPAETADTTAGDSLTIAWLAKDENLAAKPVDIAWSRDGGGTWTVLAKDVLAEGDIAWPIPDDGDGPSIIRATAIDLAGNVGVAVRSLEIAAKPVPEETVAEAEPPLKEGRLYNRKRSWLYYLMAINLMRQDKPKDALQYYWLSVKADPMFVDAWADIALAYIDVGAYRTAREVTEKARRLAPERIDLMHLTGETYHAEGMDMLGKAKSREDRVAAKELIDQAVEWYGMALEKASEDWTLAEQAPSYYRLGEICYYVNMDRDGARAYWMKILSLHSPTPNPDLILWTEPDERDAARNRHQRYTYQRVSLEAWQNWARGYVEQLDERERKGITDLMPVNRINRHGAGSSGASAPGVFQPGRADGRSLFSLPTNAGSPDPAPAAVGVASSRQTAMANAMSYESTAAGDYSFYAPKASGGVDQTAVLNKPAPRGKRSAFSGGPDAKPNLPPDPYAFPSGSRKAADWMGSGPYGNQPVDNW